MDATTKTLVIEPADCRAMAAFLIRMALPDRAAALAAILRATPAPAGAFVPATAEPMISCLMVTGDRPAMFRRAVDGYCRQTWPNKELVVVADALSPVGELEAHIAARARDDIRLVTLPGRHKLGALRNAAMAHAAGELFCVWDDDDINHPDRLRVQATAMLRDGAGASCLQDMFHCFAATGDTAWVSWGRTPFRCHPATLMAFTRDAPTYPETGPFAARSEDSVFFCQLQRRVSIIVDEPQLFLYVFHGGNTWDESHHRSIVQGMAVDAARVGARKHALDRELLRLALEAA